MFKKIKDFQTVCARLLLTTQLTIFAIIINI